ncbi:WxL protein peptidoglycan domain-containing protein [Leuconostoc lactis]|uniref:WxL protein peptidoglycan domain-containing protein n=1 Tax=Leuconostoc lactis TaxID=1246 RepID=UPI0012EAB66A|nr:DUF916 domain-containing protein [Leuconostoc lactis]
MIISQKSKIAFIILILLMFVCVSVSVTRQAFASSVTSRQATEAEISTVQKGAVGFSVNPVFNSGQQQDNVNYWSLSAIPKQTVHLKVAIINGDTDHTFEIAANQAVTNENLTVDYSKNEKVAKSMLSQTTPIDFYTATSVAKSQKNHVTLPVKKNTVVTIPIDILVPDKHFDGQAVGGISVTRQPTDSEKNQSVNNVYNYTYAIVATEGKKQPKANVSLVSMQAQAKKFNNTVKVNIENSSHAIVSDVSVKGVITNNKGRKVANIAINNGTIAPLAKFSLIFRDTDKQWVDGTYHVTLLMTDKDKNRWVINQNINITDGRSHVEKIKPSFKDDSQRLLLAIFLPLILLVLILVILGYLKILRKGHIEK